MNTATRYITLTASVQQTEAEFLEVQRGIRPKYLSSGFRELDRLLGGLPPTLIIIGAQPGIGKSGFLAGIIRSMAKARIPLGIFSLEDRHSWLSWRLLALESGADQHALRSSNVSHEVRVAAVRAAEIISRYGDMTWLDDKSSLTPVELVASAKHMITNFGVKCIMIDHLGELRYGNSRRDRFDLEVDEGLSAIRSIANEFAVPIVCATQLRRESSDREHPVLTDFANSAAIERKARIAIALTRKNDDELIAWILKNTNGPAGKFVKIPFAANAAVAIERAHGLRAVP